MRIDLDRHKHECDHDESSPNIHVMYEMEEDPRQDHEADRSEDRERKAVIEPARPWIQDVEQNPGRKQSEHLQAEMYVRVEGRPHTTTKSREREQEEECVHLKFSLVDVRPVVFVVCRGTSRGYPLGYDCSL